MPEIDCWKEADVTINGKELSFSEAMTLRVAISMFGGFIDSAGLSRDSHGRAMDAAYHANITSILKKMMLKNEDNADVAQLDQEHRNSTPEVEGSSPSVRAIPGSEL